MSQTATPIQVLVVDDQRVVREGLATLVGLIEGIEVVGMAADGASALELATALGPDVVLMDLRMPVMDGVEATRRLRQDHPDIEILVLTTYADDNSLFPALEAGARGYLTKDASAEEIEIAIREVHSGKTHLEPNAQQRLVAAVAGSRQIAHPRPGGPPAGLTNRELEVLQLIAAGLSNSEIGARLFLSNATVKSHVNRIFAKVGARDRAQAVRFAYETGLAASRD